MTAMLVELLDICGCYILGIVDANHVAGMTLKVKHNLLVLLGVGIYYVLLFFIPFLLSLYETLLFYSLKTDSIEGVNLKQSIFIANALGCGGPVLRVSRLSSIESILM